jgi:hypothetical protein
MMGMKELFEKLSGFMSEADIQKLVEAVEGHVSQRLIVEKTAIQRDLEEKYSEEYRQKLTEAVAKEKSLLIAEYDQKLVESEQRMVTTVNEVMESHVREQISDKLLENVAMVEAFAPVISGIKSVLVENGVDFNNSAARDEVITQLKESQNELMGQVGALTSKLDKTTSYLLMSEKTRSLTDENRKLVFESFKGMPYNEVKSKVDSQVGILAESEKIQANMLAESKKANDKKKLTESTQVSPKKTTKKKKKVTGSQVGDKTQGTEYLSESVKPKVEETSLVGKWSSADAADLSVAGINDEYVQGATAALLENIATKDLSGKAGILTESFEGSAPGANTGTDNLAYAGSENIYKDDPANVYRPVALALMRRSFPDIFAHKCVAVQPMNLPYGVAFAMRMVYAGTDIEAGWENVPEFAHQSGTVKVLYSYDNAGTIGAGEFNGIGTDGAKIDIYDADGKVDETKLKDEIVIADAAVGAAGNITSLKVSSQGAPLKHSEGLVIGDSRFAAQTPANGGPTGEMTELEFKLAQRPIRAANRKMGASYSLESAQDIAAMHQGLNIEKEMLNSLNYELNAQLDREILDVIKYVAEDTSANVGGAKLSDFNVDPSASGHGGSFGRWNGEVFMSIIAAIVAQSNVLALTTGRGAGNFAVVSADVATALQAAGHQFVQYKGGVNPSQSVSYIGKLNGNIDIYRDRFATGSFALVGYKGSGISEAGVIYSPYVSALTNRAINSGDFSPRIGVMSRYAITHNLLGAGRYYRLIGFAGLDKVIPNAVHNVLPGTGA